MLLRAFLKHFERMDPERYRSIGASSAGRCQRALAMAQFPETYEAIPMTPRRRARMMAGREFERIVMGTIQKELPAEAAGETAFLWPIPVDAGTLAATVGKINAGRITGHVLDGMNPNDIPRWRAECERKNGKEGNGRVRLSGIVVDTEASVVYIPALADGLADLSAQPEFHGTRYALATWEMKTIATAGFRKVLGGALDYSYRTQFAVEVDAAQLDTHVAFFYRLETSHGIEIVYSRKADHVRATFNLSNGTSIVTEGSVAEPHHEWDDVLVETPFDEKLLESARARIRRVLNATADHLPAREYGPDFTCETCEGYGEKKCAYCDEHGIAKRSKKKKDGTPKQGKPCKKSDGQPNIACPDCRDGIVEEAALGFPCSWCPFVMSCYPMVRVEIPKKAFGYPKFLVKHEEFYKADIRIEHPEKVA